MKQDNVEANSESAHACAMMCSKCINSYFRS